MNTNFKVIGLSDAEILVCLLSAISSLSKTQKTPSPVSAETQMHRKPSQTTTTAALQQRYHQHTAI